MTRKTTNSARNRSTRTVDPARLASSGRRQCWSRSASGASRGGSFSDRTAPPRASPCGQAEQGMTPCTKVLVDPRGNPPYLWRAIPFDKGTPGESRGRKATGPRLLRDAARPLTPRRTPRPPSCRHTSPALCQAAWRGSVDSLRYLSMLDVPMRALPTAVPLTLMLLVVLETRNEPTPNSLIPVTIDPASAVSRIHFTDGFLVHTIPDHGFFFTVGLLAPIADFCAGEPVEFDVRGTSQTVETPAGPINSSTGSQEPSSSTTLYCLTRQSSAGSLQLP